MAGFFPSVDARRVLAIDDSNFTVLSPLRMLKSIMARVGGEDEESQSSKPCEVFDLIIGSGMGGVMAVLLGSPFCLSLSEAEDRLLGVVEIVFFKPSLTPQERAEELETYFKDLALKYLQSEDVMFSKPSTDVTTKVMVVVNTPDNLQEQRPAILHNWAASNNIKATVCQVLRATTAYYPAVIFPVFPSTKATYSAAAIANANPIKWVRQYSLLRDSSQVIVSLGGGYPKVISNPPAHIPDLLTTMEALCKDCEAEHQTAAKHYRDSPKRYFRFNVLQGIQKIDMDRDFEDVLSKVATHTWIYMSKVHIQNCVATVANEVDRLADQTPSAHTQSTPVSKRPLKILSLDGGGLFALSELHLLNIIMKELAPDGSDALDPWKFFDFIGGSGFGGIIAILLGRLKLSIPDAIEAFHRMNAGIWTTDLKSTDDASKRFSSFGIRVDEVIKKHASEEIVRLREDECCPTAILVNFSANMDAKTGATFTTYRSRETLGSPPGLLVAEAMRATAAYRRVAPDVPLKSVHEKNLPTEIRYTSADLTLPNPTSKLIQEATRHLGSSTFDLILSLGAGNPGSHGYPDAGIDLAEILEKTCRDAECEHEVVANRFRKELDNDQIPFNPYFRFNVDQGVQDRAHWLESELPGIEEHTIKHFMNVETEDQLQSLRTLREKWASSTRQEPALLMHQMMVNELR